MSNTDKPDPAFYTDPNPYGIPDLKTLAVWVRQGLIEDQGLTPTLIIWGTAGMQIVNLPEGNPNETVGFAFEYGRMIAQEPQFGRLVRVIWFTEAFQVVKKAGEPVKPVLDATELSEATHIVAIQTFDPIDQQFQMETHRIIKDLNDRIINLQLLNSTRETPIITVEGGVIDVFMEGYNQVQREIRN